MALTKHGRFWHYDFVYKGQRYQGSTDQPNINKAKLTEAKVRSDVALEHFGLAPPKVAPMFKTFMDDRFLPYVREHNKTKPRTVAFYEEKTARLLEYADFASARVSNIDEDAIEKYTQARAAQDSRRSSRKIAPASINRELATLRKALYLAYEWRLIPRRPKVRTLPGEKERDFVVSGELENAYLAAADYPLRQAAILILDLGLRPDECVRLKKTDVTEAAVTIHTGKSKNAARVLPQTARTKAAFTLLAAMHEKSAWMFKGHRKDSHLTVWALSHMHTRLRQANDWPATFVLYSLRHTFGTRLAESGASPFDVKDLMGHSDIRVSQKYVHPTAQHVEMAMRRKELLDRLMRGEESVEVPAILEDRAKIRS